MARIPSHRQPTHPGEMLWAEFLERFEISQRERMRSGCLISALMNSLTKSAGLRRARRCGWRGSLASRLSSGLIVRYGGIFTDPNGAKPVNLPPSASRVTRESRPENLTGRIGYSPKSSLAAARLFGR